VVAVVSAWFAPRPMHRLHDEPWHAWYAASERSSRLI
jgi:hypothetical protein